MILETATVAELGLGPQGWAGCSEPNRNKLTPPTEARMPRSKPIDGFFTSTLDPAQRSTAWLEFLRAHGERASEKRSLWILVPDREAVLYVISSHQDFKRLADKFPQRWEHPNVSTKNPDYSPNWHTIATCQPTPFHGVHVTAEAIREGLRESRGTPPRFTGWDVETTLWFAWHFAEFERLGRIDENGVLTAD